MDLEMTGLDPAHDVILEIATLVTDDELVVVAEGPDLVVHQPPDALASMDEVVREMHTASGLLDELQSGVRLDEATTAVLTYIREHVPEPSKAPLAGNTVHMDRLFLARDMPEVEGWLHYRNVDVSSIKELTRRWFPRVYFASPEKTGNHRALGDIKDSIDELRYYRRTVFVPMPGPSSEEAKAAAAAVLAGETVDPRAPATE